MPVCSPLDSMANSMHSPDRVLQEQPDMAVAQAQEIPGKTDGVGRLQYPEKCELKIQVIDDTALLEPSVIGNAKLKEVKVEKKAKRRVRKTRKKKEAVEKGGERKGKEIPVVKYSRKDIEALRFENLEDQKRKWIEVYSALDTVVAGEYDGLVDPANGHLKNCVPSMNIDPRAPVQKSANLFAVAAMVKANPLIITAH